MEASAGTFANLHHHSEACKTSHAGALHWLNQIRGRAQLVWLEPDALALPEQAAPPSAPAQWEAWAQSRFLDRLAIRSALPALFAEEDFPAEANAEAIRWRRDELGKPYVAWQDDVEDWARRQSLSWHHLHVSNTHDGSAHIVLAVYNADLIGLGVDVVYLPRLRRGGKDSPYLRRMAKQFMGAAEWQAFAEQSEGDNEEELRVRVAAHFSLMEAASKACGTGLRIGAGMGRATSLPKQALGVCSLSPTVTWQFGPEATERMAALGAEYQEGFWGADGEYLVSAALFWK